MPNISNETILKISSDIATIREKVENIHKKLFGNGQPGLVQEFEDVKSTQKHCLISQKNKKIDLKWLVTTGIAIIAIGIAIAQMIYINYK